MLKMSKKSEQMNSNYRMFKAKLNNLKNVTKHIIRDPMNDINKFKVKKDKIKKSVQALEESKDTGESAAKRKYNLYLLYKELESISVEEQAIHEKSRQQEEDLKKSDDILEKEKRLGKYRLKEVLDNPN